MRPGKFPNEPYLSFYDPLDACTTGACEISALVRGLDPPPFYQFVVIRGDPEYAATAPQEEFTVGDGGGEELRLDLSSILQERLKTTAYYRPFTPEEQQSLRGQYTQEQIDAVNREVATKNEELQRDPDLRAKVAWEQMFELDQTLQSLAPNKDQRQKILNIYAQMGVDPKQKYPGLESQQANGVILHDANERLQMYGLTLDMRTGIISRSTPRTTSEESL